MNFALIAAAALAVGNPGEFRYGANDVPSAPPRPMAGDGVQSTDASRPADTVLLDFRADWCGPCRSMDPVVAQLKAQGYPVRQVNVDQERALANRFHVSGIPCFVLLVNGKEVDRAVGAGDDSGHSRDFAQFAAMFRRNGVGPGINSARGTSRDAAVASTPAASQAIPFPVSDRNENAVHRNADSGRAARDAQSEQKPYEKLVRASVRLRIEDETGNSVGSGTIIDSRAGEALIVTCGHVFRDAAKDGRIMVDLFGPNAPQQVPGHLIDYDLKSEVGLVSISTNYPVAVAKLAPANYKVRTGDHVVSVGCDGGAAATAKETHVVSLNRY
ncbi:MAG TPA: thioredoxin domain-containing protein, partial [Pirellulales bacterium]